MKRDFELRIDECELNISSLNPQWSKLDFRSVCATILDRWLGADPVRILGANFGRVEFI